ncbi:hypothetical protein V5N11_017838 [Cardamine amara subsp. amara]|uniref:No apical meristem-associated C-terminal domain-containing protein n=1 Tax=Cardamine amara subsp. amara TaxID=228776 RepID=A0ABD0ZZA1_CARAN
MTTIIAANSKLRGCVNQIDNKNPSGASEQDILNQAKMLLAQDPKYPRGFRFDHVWPILKGIEKFANKNTNTSTSFQEEGRDVMSSLSFSSPSPGMSSIDLNMNTEEATFNVSSRPMGSKKAKRKQQTDEQFKQMMEQNEKLIKSITKSSSERNEIQRQKIEVAKIKQEHKIMFADLSSITDPASRAYIEMERKRILREKAQTNQYEEHGEGCQSQYHGSQYRASQYQGDQSQEDQFQGEQVGEENQGEEEQGEDQRAPNDPEYYTPYYDYISGTGTNFPAN